MSDGIRINKYIADAGICSRRDADKLIEAGKIFINGKTAKMGDKITGNCEVRVGKKVIGGSHQKVVLAFYKPIGVTCTERDKFAQKTITEYVNYPIRVTYAGRLDKDSEGLILLTNDGDLIQALMKGSNGHEKEYVVKVNKEVTPEFTAAMEAGVYLHELEQKTKHCRMEIAGKYTFRIILTQGLNRQIRRMCKELGFTVTALKRVRVGEITIGSLQSGQYRMLTDEERTILYQSVGLKA